MEIKFKEGDSVNIPENCVAKIVNNVVVFEPKTVKFKKGDFVITKDGLIMAIFKESIDGESFCEYFGVGVNGDLTYFDGEPFGSIENYRLMTDSEKQILLDKLHENGKDWDAEKCEIVDWDWKPKIGECIFGLSCVGVSPNTWRNFSYQRDALANKMIFKTRELAEAAFELIKNSKHF